MTEITFSYWLLRVTDRTDDLIQVWEKISIDLPLHASDKSTNSMEGMR